MNVSVCDRSKGGKNPENNKLGPLCAATLYDVLHNRKWKIPRLALSSWTVKERHIKLGVESGESVMSHRTEGRLVPVNLSGWPDTSANAGSLCGVALPSSPHPHTPPSFSLVLPPASRWIFSHSLTPKTLLTARATARERESEENVCACMCDVVWAPGYANRTALVSQCEQTPKKE